MRAESSTIVRKQPITEIPDYISIKTILVVTTLFAAFALSGHFGQFLPPAAVYSFAGSSVLFLALSLIANHCHKASFQKALGSPSSLSTFATSSSSLLSSSPSATPKRAPAHLAFAASSSSLLSGAPSNPPFEASSSSLLSGSPSASPRATAKEKTTPENPLLINFTQRMNEIAELHFSTSIRDTIEEQKLGLHCSLHQEDSAFCLYGSDMQNPPFEAMVDKYFYAFLPKPTPNTNLDGYLKSITCTFLINSYTGLTFLSAEVLESIPLKGKWHEDKNKVYHLGEDKKPISYNLKETPLTPPEKVYELQFAPKAIPFTPSDLQSEDPQFLDEARKKIARGFRSNLITQIELRHSQAEGKDAQTPP